MEKEIVQNVRFSRSVQENLRQVAVKMAESRQRPVPLSVVIRRCLEVGLPIVQREAHGIVLQDTTKTESERIGEAAVLLVRRGYDAMVADMEKAGILHEPTEHFSPNQN